MSHESTELILGDAAAAASEEVGRRRRRFFRRRKKDEPAPPTHCENCHAQLAGAYCSVCGQHAIDYRRSLLAVMADAADSFFNWDTKFVKSLGVLLVWPWRLTNDFNAGRRVRYVHPLRLYLLASIAFFLIAKLVNLTPDTSGSAELTPDQRTELNAKLAQLVGPDSVFNDEQKAKIEQARVRLIAAGALTKQERVEVRAAIAPPADGSAIPKNVRQQRAKLKELLGDIPAVLPLPPPAKPGEANFIGPMPEGAPIPSPSASAERGIHFRAGTPPPNAGLFQIDVSDSDKKSDQSKDAFERWLEGRIKDKIGENGTKGKLFLETLRNNLPTMMLCCIPLFAFVLKVLYLRRRRFYVEHLVYALHIHTFVYVAVVVITLVSMGADRWLPGWSGLLIGLLTPVAAIQVFLSVRRVYGQGWFFTAGKFLLGGVAYFFILVFAVAATALVTLMLPD